jgi:hypothetical protein
MKLVARGAAFLVCTSALACSTGEGKGRVASDRLFIEGCWNGGFDLKPTFFAAQPHLSESLMIRVQRGDDIEEVSDGLLVVVEDVANIRQNHRNQELDVGLPVGVTPPGFPVRANPNPPKVSLALYLQETCHLQNAAVYSVEGTITFRSLFSGDPNEDNAEDRLTDASFNAKFADPRKATPGPQGELVFADEVVSEVEGDFNFYFQRGQPAQRFP